MLADLVADPASFFAEREHGLAGPLAVVALTVGFAATGNLVASLDAIEHAAARADPGSLAALGVTSAFVPAIWLTVVLLFYAVAFHVLAASFGADVPFGASMSVVGWGFVPKLFVAVTSLTVVLFATVPAASTLGPEGQFVVLVEAGLPIPMLALGAVIWYHGLRVVHGLDRGQAATSVGVPVALALVVNLLALLLGLAGIARV
jgi:hypothetical protein